jgi:hypothetical protein
MRLFSFDPKKGRQVPAGEFIYGCNEICNYSRVFIKNVNSRHYMIKEKSYGISEDVIEQLIQLECTDIIIKTKNREYHYLFSEILNQPIKNYGHGEQRFLKVRGLCEK